MAQGDIIVPQENISGNYDEIALEVSDIGVPIKATGSDINTGTDDAKFVTSKAIADSNVFRAEKVAQISSLTDKVTPVDADAAIIDDSAASNAKKKVTWNNIKVTLRSYFDTLYKTTFSENTAFNKNFGSVTGTVTEGNDSRLSDNRTPIDNSVTYTKIATDLKSSAAISASDIDWSTAGVFTKTLTAAATFTFSNLQLNKVITVVLTGDYTVTLPASVKIISGTYDGTVPNYLQFHCTDATTPVVWCVISQEA